MMSFDDRAADKQPDPHTATLGGVERFENFLEILRINAGPDILHAEAHAIVCFSPGSDQQLPRAVINTKHCVGSVPDQVQDDLLQRDTIADDKREVLGKL